MRHPTEGVLRRLLDEPAGVAVAEREHIAGCAQCLDGLAAMRVDAALVDEALATEGVAEVDVAAAWRRLSESASDTKPSLARRPARARRPRGVLRRPAVAALAAAFVLSGAAIAAANDWLPIFQTKQIAPLSLTTADFTGLPDLRAYGELEVTGSDAVRTVASASVAAAQTGLDVPEVTELPAGVVGDPVHQVVGEVSATFTFSAERAAEAATEAGTSLPTPPRGLDGSRVRLDAGPGVAQIWTSEAGAPALVVGRAVAPKAFSSGVAFATVRDYLLSLPGLPADVAAQLRKFTADGSTLPLPVPADEVTTSSATVDGVPATVLSARDRTMAAVVWVEDGVLTAVGGSLDADELLAVAEELR